MFPSIVSLQDLSNIFASNPAFTVGSTLACPTTHHLSSSLARATRSAFLSSAFYLFAVHWYSILPQDVAAALGISVLVRAPSASFLPYRNTSQYPLYLKPFAAIHPSRIN